MRRFTVIVLIALLVVGLGVTTSLAQGDPLRDEEPKDAPGVMAWLQDDSGLVQSGYPFHTITGTIIDIDADRYWGNFTRQQVVALLYALDQQNDALEGQIGTLEGQIGTLETRIETLQAQVVRLEVLRIRSEVDALGLS